MKRFPRENTMKDWNRELDILKIAFHERIDIMFQQEQKKIDYRDVLRIYHEAGNMLMLDRSLQISPRSFPFIVSDQGS